MNGKRFSGRSSSQISIYDYPEHLNPFYEDEQHKRLRFWKIGKRSDKVKRSNSFSLDGFKEFWTLKSFRLKKKSSSLGVNKTSESPPPLRRSLMVEEHDADRVYHTLDPSTRHTVSVGLNSGFERGVRYRSSLQDMSSFNQSPFNRADRYRNTMQNGQEFVNRGGSKTPQMSSRYSGNLGNHLAHSSSQQSINSTNPFDDEVSQASTSAQASAKKPVRKKRRAPLPPTPKITPQTSANENEKNVKDVEAISNLTAQIESFVKSSEAEEESKECREISIPVPARRREKKEAPKFQVTKTKAVESGIELRITESTDDLTSDSPAKGEAKTVEKSSVIEEKSTVVEKESPKREFVEIVQVEEVPKETSKEQSQKDREMVGETSKDDSNCYQKVNVDASKDISDPSQKVVKETSKDKSDLSQKVTVDTSKDKSDSPQTVAKDTSKDISDPSQKLSVDTSKDKSDPYRNVVVEMEKYEIRFAPLKTNDDLAGENHRRNPIERQRSVQEIIESINKNQSLLKINYEDDSRVQSIMQDIESQKMDAQRRKSADSLNRNIRELEIKEREMRELIRELEEASDIPVVVQEFNNNSFDKCVRLREVETDQNDNQTVKRNSIEWNPLPKPRRSRNLSSEDVDVPT